MRPRLLLYVICVLFGCVKKEESISPLAIALLGQNINSARNASARVQPRFPIPNCDVPAPAFSSLAAAGFETTCGRSGCHSVGAGNVYVATSYAEVRSQTNPGNPIASSLYTEQSTGRMVANTTFEIDKAIYCWIKGGSNP